MGRVAFETVAACRVKVVFDNPEFARGSHPALNGLKSQPGGPFERARRDHVAVTLLSPRPDFKSDALLRLVPLVLGATSANRQLTQRRLHEQRCPSPALQQFFQRRAILAIVAP